MDLVFKALADATRRELLDKLYDEPGQSLSGLCDGITITRQSISKHLRQLEQAELVSVQWHGREKRYYLNPLPIARIGERWIDKFSRSRAQALLRIQQALESQGDKS